MNSVRLECVMHAASVNPEPGSNSLKISISNPLRHLPITTDLIPSFQSYCLSFFLTSPGRSPCPSGSFHAPGLSSAPPPARPCFRSSLCVSFSKCFDEISLTIRIPRRGAFPFRFDRFPPVFTFGLPVFPFRVLTSPGPYLLFLILSLLFDFQRATHAV